MRVYRVENKSGEGVYTAQNASTRIQSDSPQVQELVTHMHRSMPCPYRDFSDEDYNKFDSDYFFGFNSIEQLKEWFPKAALKLFKRKGFTVNIYDVDKEFVIFGGRQVCFIKEKSRLIKGNISVIMKG